jgi:hypothetical protein
MMQPVETSAVSVALTEEVEAKMKRREGLGTLG